MDTISVVIPTYHRYEPLERTVNDLLKQTVPPSQIIVVDNTSTAERLRPDYLESTAATECVYISSSQVGRVNVAREEGLAEVTSTFALYFDDDMSIASDCIENLLIVHREGWDAVTGTIFEQGRTLDTSEIVANRPLWSVLRTQHGPRPGTTIGVPSGLVSVRTAILRNIGGFDPAYIYNYDDYDLGIRLWRSGCVVWRDPRVSVHHLKVSSGGGGLNSKSQRKLNKITAKYYFLSKHFGKRATKLELLNDIWCAFADIHSHPISLVRQLIAIRRGYKMYPAYGLPGDSIKRKASQTAVEI